MEDIEAALDGILQNDLSVMKEKFSAALSSKVADKLEELKIDTASTFFEKR